MPEKVTLVAPFWRQPGHIGNLRVERFLRWLQGAGRTVVLVRAGARDSRREQPWGVEVTLADPLGLHPEPSAAGAGAIEPRRPNRLRRALAYALLVPDPAVAWALRAGRHGLTLEEGQGSAWVLSTSPPESSHLAAARIARMLGASLAVDLRDGWLDEPLKPQIQHAGPRRWIEGWMERRVLQQARTIFVTSGEWKRLLEKRRPLSRGKTLVLTNACPSFLKTPAGRAAPRRHPPASLRLLHAGRLTGSSGTRRLGLLLEPLRRAGPQTPGGEAVLLGELSEQDIFDAEEWTSKMKTAGWRLTLQPAVLQEDVAGQLAAASGLLVLSASQAAIPGKFFEYLSAGPPILAVSLPGSALWRLAEKIPHVYLASCAPGDDPSGAAARFLEACRAGTARAEIPEELTAVHGERVFRKGLGLP